MAKKVETFGIFTNRKQENSSWESNISTTIHDVPGIPRKMLVHYRVNKSPPLVPILAQINPVQALQPDLRKMHFSIILTSTFRSSN